MRGRWWKRLTVSVLIPLAMSACVTGPKPNAGERSTGETLTGMVTSWAPISLPQDAVMRVELVDISRQGGPPRTVTLTEIWVDGRHFPLSFKLPYPSAAIDSGRAYALLVKITQGGRLLFENAAPCPVITNGVRSNIEIVVKPGAGS